MNAVVNAYTSIWAAAPGSTTQPPHDCNASVSQLQHRRRAQPVKATFARYNAAVSNTTRRYHSVYLIGYTLSLSFHHGSSSARQPSSQFSACLTSASFKASISPSFFNIDCKSP